MARNMSVKIEFFKFYNIVKRQVMNCFQNEIGTMNQPTFDYLEKVLDYNVPCGKLNRGIMLVQAYTDLNDKHDVNFNISRACKLGWAIEMLHSSFLIMDDIIDYSTTRRGRDCWYKLENVGMKAVNDGLLLENSVDLIIRQELTESPCLGKIINAFHEAKIATLLGQHLDSQKFDLEFCTPSLYADIVRLKTSHYTFLLPVIIALNLSSNDLIDNTELSNLCFKLGHYFQVQDDYLDCYGDPDVTGKIGTDIADGKCSWFLVEALLAIKSDSADFVKLKENYGKTTAQIENVKILYEKFGLLEKYRKFETDFARNIEHSIDSLDNSAKLKPFFRNVLNDLRGRNR